MSKKNIIIFSILAIILVLAIVGTILAIKLIKEPEDEPAFDVWPGEDSLGNASHLAYPMIDDHNDVLKLEIRNESGNFTFIEVWDEGSAKYVWRMEEYKDVPLNLSAFEMLRMHASTATTKTPIRNVSEADMKEWGCERRCSYVFKRKNY